VEANPALKDRLGLILYNCAEAIRVASVLLSPAMPTKMDEFWPLWGCAPRPVTKLVDLAAFGGEHRLQPGSEIKKGEPLFMRADPKLDEPKGPTAA
jgi:methionyl-tRNA synthetase